MVALVFLNLLKKNMALLASLNWRFQTHSETLWDIVLRCKCVSSTPINYTSQIFLSKHVSKLIPYVIEGLIGKLLMASIFNYGLIVGLHHHTPYVILSKDQSRNMNYYFPFPISFPITHGTSPPSHLNSPII